MAGNADKKILVVEDDQFLREFYQELLLSEGYTVEIADNGEVGEQKLLVGGYDLVLLDIMMPKKDGLQVLRDLKIKIPSKPNKQIVMLTNLGQDAIIKQCFDLGAAGFLIKSALNPDQVLAEINNYLQKT
jgi:DNA-binding response OmpR family regulator